MQLGTCGAATSWRRCRPRPAGYALAGGDSVKAPVARHEDSLVAPPEATSSSRHGADRYIECMYVCMYELDFYISARIRVLGH
jgi:hypothetical protein